MDMSLGLEDQVIAALRRITRAIDLQSRSLLSKYGITTPQLTTLQTLVRTGPLSIGALAREIHLGHATVTGILSRLEQRELVSRRRGDHDRRSVLVELTAEGTQLLDRTPSLLHERFRDELSHVEEWERTMILATLQRIASMMDAEGLDAAPVLVSGATVIPDTDVVPVPGNGTGSIKEGVEP